MDWKKVTIPEGSKIVKVHNFIFMHKGVNYHLEVDEYLNGHCSGFGEQATDKNYVIDSVSGKNVSECLNLLTQKITSRG